MISLLNIYRHVIIITSYILGTGVGIIEVEMVDVIDLTSILLAVGWIFVLLDTIILVVITDTLLVIIIVVEVGLSQKVVTVSPLLQLHL